MSSIALCQLRWPPHLVTPHSRPVPASTPRRGSVPPRQIHSSVSSLVARRRAGSTKWYGLFQSQKLALHLVALLKRTSQPPEVQRMVLNKCRIAVAKEDAAAAVERVVVHLSVWQHRVEDDDLALLRVAGPSQHEPGRGVEESPRCDVYPACG